MPKCMLCKKSVISGYVLCSHCVKSLEPHSLPAELAFVLDQLAEEITLSENIPACSLCQKGGCSSQVSGLVCRTGVKDWLVDRAKEYLLRFTEETQL